jgi:tetrahydromethanopterin S-methyltransferase subunit E
MPSDYRLSPALGARLVGLLIVGLAVLVFVATGVVAVLNLHSLVLVPVALVVLAVVFGVGALVRGATVVHFDDDGYRVRMVRGAGVKVAAWKDVSNAGTATRRGVRCVVLNLRDGRTTTIPVDAVAADRDAFVRDLQAHLQRGHGLRPLDGP